MVHWVQFPETSRKFCPLEVDLSVKYLDTGIKEKGTYGGEIETLVILCYQFRTTDARSKVALDTSPFARRRSRVLKTGKTLVFG